MAVLVAVYNDNQDHPSIHGYLHAKTRRQRFSFCLFCTSILFIVLSYYLLPERGQREFHCFIVHNDNEDHLFIQDYLHANTLSLMHTTLLTCMFYLDNVLMFIPSRMDNWFDEFHFDFIVFIF